MGICSEILVGEISSTIDIVFFSGRNWRKRGFWFDAPDLGLTHLGVLLFISQTGSCPKRKDYTKKLVADIRLVHQEVDGGGVRLLYELPAELIDTLAALSRSQIIETSELLIETLPFQEEKWSHEAIERLVVGLHKMCKKAEKCKLPVLHFVAA